MEMCLAFIKREEQLDKSSKTKTKAKWKIKKIAVRNVQLITKTLFVYLFVCFCLWELRKPIPVFQVAIVAQDKSHILSFKFFFKRQIVEHKCNLYIFYLQMLKQLWSSDFPEDVAGNYQFLILPNSQTFLK